MPPLYDPTRGSGPIPNPQDPNHPTEDEQDRAMQMVSATLARARDVWSPEAAQKKADQFIDLLSASDELDVQNMAPEAERARHRFNIMANFLRLLRHELEVRGQSN